MSSSNWLGWANRFRDSSDNDSHDDAKDSEAEPEHESEEYHDDNQDDNIDDNADDNNDEIVDHVQLKKKGWNFWNSSHDGVNEPKKVALELKPEPESSSNTILLSKTSIQNVHDYKNAIQNEAEISPPPDQVDDAVLYKPHHKASQFNKINTHKNENLKENVLVPEWGSCLPEPTGLYTLPSATTSTSLARSLFGNTTTSNTNSVVDVKNWRNYLHQLSTRLGFSSQQLTSVVDEVSTDQVDEAVVEKEFNILYERTYKLYGKSLAILPVHKRACLPNYNKSYTEEPIEEDPENEISISNDPMGNLLINHKRLPRSHSPDIVSLKLGNLTKIKKIMIIGVHGFFPTKMIRPLIGSPKGTSLKFANEAEKGIIRYCIENGMISEEDSNSVSIQKIALEKEGKIFDRVDFFTDILVKWKNELNDADFIFVASHSQGTVVSIILLAKLIQMGVLKDAIKKRIGILGMAGINNGPFFGADQSFFVKAYSAIEHDSLAELFELNKFNSQQSLVYKEAIQTVINVNVKLCFVGSINDQLVPLYSALASHVFHPNIYRACYIEHSSQTPLFTQKLVSLCCQLQNLGFFDNNVLKELSHSLAGPLTGGGHSKLYSDGKVYDLGIKFILDTDDIIIPPAPVSVSRAEETHVTPVALPITNQVYIKEYNISKVGTNPFLLPWCLRGFLFNIEKNWPNQKTSEKAALNGYEEINSLYDLFEAWKPETKVQKDLKFRLNGIRASKL